MKTGQFILAAAAGLILAAPVFADTMAARSAERADFIGSYGEGALWTDLLTDRDRLASEPAAPAVAPTAATGRTYGNVYDQVTAINGELGAGGEVASGVAGRAGEPMGETGLYGAPDTRGEVSVYEQIIHTPH